jgi:hypothetical protein
MAMLGVYEQQDVSLAAELFDWTYRRSITKYRAILESMGAPDPLRAKHREHLGDAIRQIVATGSTLPAAVEALAIPEADQPAFIELLRVEPVHLEPRVATPHALNHAQFALYPRPSTHASMARR